MNIVFSIQKTNLEKQSAALCMSEFLIAKGRIKIMKTLIGGGCKISS